jgi:small-conductance mechanosensitive channel
MTAKEKAIRLVDRFKADTVIYTRDGNGYTLGVEIRLQNAKNCALICVEEILESHYKVLVGVMPKTYDYWQEVKQEINKL